MERDRRNGKQRIWRERVARSRTQILGELRKVIVGQDEVVDEVLIALFSRRPLPDHRRARPGQDAAGQDAGADPATSSFKRIQFTPDLMPADITGTEVLDEEDGHRPLRFVHGPIFAHIILADEINRTPPKTQAALLEAMQEYHVTAAGRTYALERPFFVLATQNPIELEGTYPLPEAQLDRFLFNVVMTYLSRRRRGEGGDRHDRARRGLSRPVSSTAPTSCASRSYVRQVLDRRRGRALRRAAGRQLAARTRRASSTSSRSG